MISIYEYITYIINMIKKIIVFLFHYFISSKKEELTTIEKLKLKYLPIIKRILSNIMLFFSVLLYFNLISRETLDLILFQKFSLLLTLLDYICELLIKLGLKDILDNFHPEILFNYLVEKKSE